jgi:RNA polymerase sigma-70 factor (ECF subfamily)
VNVEVRDIETRREEDAVRRCLRGERVAFEELVGPHLPVARGLALRLLGNLEDAQDAVQEALFKAWRGLPGWRPELPFGAWLLRIVFNQCVDARRRRGTRSRHERLAPAAPPAPPADRSAQRETLRRVAEAFARLPPRQAAALHLRVLEELDYASIGALLGLSGASARIYVVRARITLRRLLARELEEP